MDGVGGKRVRRVVKVDIVMGNPARGMEFKTMGEFVGELSGDIRGDIRVKDKAIVKEGVLEMKKGRVGDGGRSLLFLTGTRFVRVVLLNDCAFPFI